MENLDLYRCDVCGNFVEIVFAGNGELICCGKPMTKLEPKTNEKNIIEKHVPIILNNNENLEVRVGEVLHPMLDEHHIMFIEVISGDKNRVERQYLYAGQEPKMFTKNNYENIYAREYCNIHGLWEGK